MIGFPLQYGGSQMKSDSGSLVQQLIFEALYTRQKCYAKAIHLFYDVP